MTVEKRMEQKKVNRNVETIVEMEIDFLENYFEETNFISDYVQKQQPISDTF